jgi:hypothetical protein
MSERKFAELLKKVAQKQELTQEELQELAQTAGEIEQEFQELDNETIPDSMNRVVQVSRNSSGELEVESLGFAYEQVQKLAEFPSVETTQVYKQKVELQQKEQLINAIVFHLQELNKSELEVLVKLLNIEVAPF